MHMQRKENVLKYIEIIKQNPLFKGIAENDLKTMLSCLSSELCFYHRGSFVFLTGESINRIGIVLSGKIIITKEDEFGNRGIIAEAISGEMFGEAFACSEIMNSSVSAQTAEDSEVLLIDYKRIFTTCPSACAFHTKLIENMLMILAKKILILNQKIDIISQRTTREKLMTYFEIQKGIAKSDKFTIPYNREELADFLFVDRSAMSRELSRMRDEGLIDFYKNKFEML